MKQIKQNLKNSETFSLCVCIEKSGRRTINRKLMDSLKNGEEFGRMSPSSKDAEQL